MKFYRAAEAFRMLNGVFCVYKPRGFQMKTVLKDIRDSLCKDLNSLEIRPPGFVQKDVTFSDPVTDEVTVS